MFMFIDCMLNVRVVIIVKVRLVIINRIIVIVITVNGRNICYSRNS